MVRKRWRILRVHFWICFSRTTYLKIENISSFNQEIYATTCSYHFRFSRQTCNHFGLLLSGEIWICFPIRNVNRPTKSDTTGIPFPTPCSVQLRRRKRVTFSRRNYQSSSFRNSQSDAMKVGFRRSAYKSESNLTGHCLYRFSIVIFEKLSIRLSPYTVSLPVMLLKIWLQLHWNSRHSRWMRIKTNHSPIITDSFNANKNYPFWQ